MRDGEELDMCRWWTGFEDADRILMRVFLAVVGREGVLRVEGLEEDDGISRI